MVIERISLLWVMVIERFSPHLTVFSLEDTRKPGTSALHEVGGSSVTTTEIERIDPPCLAQMAHLQMAPS